MKREQILFANGATSEETVHQISLIFCLRQPCWETVVFHSNSVLVQVLTASAKQLDYAVRLISLTVTNLTVWNYDTIVPSKVVCHNVTILMCYKCGKVLLLYE
jgi:hypothetical protein